MKSFKIWTVFELMQYYIQSGRIKVDPSHHQMPMTVHDPCNYGRKSQIAFGKGYFDEIRWVAQQCAPNFVEMNPTKMNNFCCGAGGGAWAMPYSEERIYYGRKKAEQIRDTGAELVVAPCHNCRDQIMKSLTKEYNLGIETMYLWELVAESLIIEPWSDEEVEKAHQLRDEQFEKFGVELEEEEMEEDEEE
jgi:dimethylglycine catabolism B